MDDEDWDTSVSVAGNYHYEQETSIGLNGSNGSAASDVRIQGGPGDSLVELQYERLKARYEDAGYREGIEPGKLSTLQAGFDSGFAASVGPSRRLGQLRGRTQVLVQLSSKSGGSSAQGTPSELGNRARALLSDLNRIKREQTLAVDHEAEAHARMEHPEDFPEDADGRPRSEKPSAVDEALGFVKEGSRREMEVLEDALERMSGGGGGGSGDKGGSELREGALLDAMERRVVELEVAFGLQSPTFK